MATRIELKDSGVIFNKEEHTYRIGDTFLSGITGMLQRQLFPNEFDGIPSAVLNAAANYGNGVHQSCEDFDLNWINDGTQEVADYIRICKENNLAHEMSEYTVSDSMNYASNIDKVYRVSDDTFSLGDIKTYGVMSPKKREKAKWQLSIYAYLFELQNKKAKIDKLFIIHLRNKRKKNGEIDHIAKIIFLDRIPSEICKELLDADLAGLQFVNPYEIPKEFKKQEPVIRELLQTKAKIEEKLSSIKASILLEMESTGAQTWLTDTMRISRKLPSTRTSFNLVAFKSDHPDLEYDAYMKTTQVGGSLQIAI